MNMPQLGAQVRLIDGVVMGSPTIYAHGMRARRARPSSLACTARVQPSARPPHACHAAQAPVPLRVGLWRVAVHAARCRHGPWRAPRRQASGSGRPHPPPEADHLPRCRKPPDTGVRAPATTVQPLCAGSPAASAVTVQRRRPLSRHWPGRVPPRQGCPGPLARAPLQTGPSVCRPASVPAHALLHGHMGTCVHGHQSCLHWTTLLRCTLSLGAGRPALPVRQHPAGRTPAYPAWFMVRSSSIPMALCRKP